MAQDGWNRDADSADCHHPEGPLPCSNNCGLFGSPATLNFCSKCYQEVVLKPGSPFPPIAQPDLSVISSLGEKCLEKSADLDVLPSISANQRVFEDSVALAASQGLHLSPALPAAAFSQQAEQIHRRNANRCLACRKRVGLLGFKCRCGDVFCSVHRYSEKHNCSFDYKAAGRDAIAKANPIVKADKVQKI